MSDALLEEAVEEAADWVERGRLRRIWKVVKITALTIALLIGAAVLYLVEGAN